MTHPHEDHIGGADAVIGRYKVGATVMPAVTGTTVAFERVLSAIEANGCTLELAEVGAEYSLGDAKMTVLAPCGTDYDGMNNYSIVLRVDYGNVSFLLTGDAEVESEEEMCARHSPSLLDCDLLKIGHHGSSSSSSDSFLDAVSPAAVLISCGRDNNYGHPDESVTDRLTARGIPYYRTDELGDIVVRTDGRKIVVD